MFYATNCRYVHCQDIQGPDNWRVHPLCIFRACALRLLVDDHVWRGKNNDLNAKAAKAIRLICTSQGLELSANARQPGQDCVADPTTRKTLDSFSKGQ